MFTELQSLRRKVDQQHHQMSAGDQVVRELRARESDLQESLAAKDAQLGILRVRLEEADSELKSKKQSLTKVEEEKNR